MATRTPSPTPSEVFAEEVKAARRRRGWTQQDLADALDNVGSPIDRSLVASIETKRRGVSLDEALAFAVALGVSPSALALPRDDLGEVRLAPGLSVASGRARLWWQGAFDLGTNATRYFQDSASDVEARAFEVLPEVRNIWRGAAVAIQHLGSLHKAPQYSPETATVGDWDATDRELQGIEEDAKTALRKFRRARAQMAASKEGN